MSDAVSDARPATDGLAGMPTGPELAMRLALLDPHEVADEQLLELLRAQWRQLAYTQAQTWAVLAELAVRDPFPNLPGGARWNPVEVFDNAVDEVRAELVVTRRFAETELGHAALLAELPQVMAALTDGRIDRARAIKFAEGCVFLTAEQTEVLLDELLPNAAAMTATELAEQIKRLAIALDPTWARHRYTQAVKQRRVIGYLNEDGSATVTGQHLPVDDAAMACARVDALADAAKRAGAKATIDHLRAELFLGLLDGRFHGLTEHAIITELRRLFPEQRGETAEPAPHAVEPTPATAAGEPAPEEVLGITRGVHLRVALSTLLGLDDEPGEIAGWGEVPASLARRIATRQRSSEWRYAILDERGRLVFDGSTRRRPRSRNTGAVQPRSGIVELRVSLDLLTDPTLGERHPHWARVLADLAGQHARRHPIDQDPNARFAGRQLRRRQQTRYQRCLFPGCRRPASDCDLDHRRNHAYGGQTSEQNTAPVCRHDHGLKTSRGWRLIRRNQHTYLWVSPLTRKHVITIGPIAAPLPKPIPRLLPPERDYPGRTRTVETNPDPPPF